MKTIRVRAAAFIKKNEKLLLLQHYKNGKKYWVIPGGGVEFGEKIEDALKRELKEELNIIINVRDLLFINESIYPDRSRHIINLYFDCDYIKGIIKLGHEKRLSDFKFFSLNEIEKIKIYPNIKNQIKYFLERKEIIPKYAKIPWEK